MSVVLSSIALIIAISTFLYLYILPAKFKLEHIAKNPDPEANNSYIHILTIVNIRNKTGILKGIQLKSSSEKAGVNREKVEVIWGSELTTIHEESPYAVVAVGAKESIIIKCYVTIIDYTNKRIIPKYKIKLTLDESTKFSYNEKDEFLEVGYDF